MPPSDRELLEDWRQGSAAAGNALFDRHFSALYRFFRNKVGDGIDDLVQRTFLGCVEGLERFRAEASFRTYLFAIARNELYDHAARSRRDAQRFDPMVTTVEDLAPTPSRIVAHKSEQRLLLAALRRIPLANQIALELFHFEDLSGPQIAEVLGIPEPTVRGRLARARQQLREQLELLASDPGLLRSTTTDLDGWARSLRACVGPPDRDADG